jgi:sulfur carrier protein
MKGYTTAGVLFHAAFFIDEKDAGGKWRRRMVRINGETRAVQGILLEQYLADEGYQRERIAVECNGEIVPKAEYGTRVLQDGDVLEIVSFVGGG